MVNVFVCFFAILVGATVSAQTLHDPTAPKEQSTKLESRKQVVVAKPKLQSILVQNDHRSAVINNQNVRVGDRVDGYRVTQITAKYVLLQGKGGTIRLSLFNADFIK
ncbi:hypothetical protein [Motilimonas sp. KMU-193]|uniref:hypothetical protein n=1 Tax=Motilimonas sp. KMU-193 TaxID=3388668 RepID=UPI00396B3CA3